MPFIRGEPPFSPHPFNNDCAKARREQAAGLRRAALFHLLINETLFARRLTRLSWRSASGACKTQSDNLESFVKRRNVLCLLSFVGFLQCRDSRIGVSMLSANVQMHTLMQRITPYTHNRQADDLSACHPPDTGLAPKWTKQPHGYCMRTRFDRGWLS